ncbi:Uncharacterized protein DAT39_016253 [Clarias magur]|uniref:Uncharacterized protein n=1 Tax=Clarias magur TaxID=1594786 RepID=A0A8J4X5M0_CLAMG|nr:Uncharacterized protein DAT39_016253 [Clarias magur]
MAASRDSRSAVTPNHARPQGACRTDREEHKSLLESPRFSTDRSETGCGSSMLSSLHSPNLPTEGVIMSFA